MMAPFAPCASSELWNRIHSRGSEHVAGNVYNVFAAGWPVVDESASKKHSRVFVVMVKFVCSSLSSL
jgi:leucyl-tRNA synthetase